MVQIWQGGRDFLRRRLFGPGWSPGEAWVAWRESQGHRIKFWECYFKVESNGFFRRLYTVLSVSYQAASEIELITQ